MLFTNRLGLRKPEPSDLALVGDFNSNSDKIDIAIDNIEKGLILFGKLETSGNLVCKNISSDDIAAKKILCDKINGKSFNNNFSVAAQVIPAASRTYIIGSNLKIKPEDLKIGTMFRWTFDVTKTAAGTAASIIDICFGTAGSTADTARVSFTKPAGTAVIDNGIFTIDAIIRGPLSASGIVVGHMNMTHNLAATGLCTLPAVNVTTISSAFSLLTPTNVGVCITTGAADAYTIQMVKAVLVQ